MKIGKITVILTEALCIATAVFLFLAGVLLFIGSAPLKWTVGIAVICLSICAGILIPNFVSFSTLLLGVLTLVLPPWLMAIVFLLLCAMTTVLCVKIYKEYFLKATESVK